MDLTLSQGLLALLLLSSVAVGFGLGILYDGLRLLRLLRGEGNPCRPSPTTVVRPWPRRLLLFLEDFLFALFCVISLILLLYYTNDGQPRVLAIPCMASGFFIYYHTLSRLFMTVSEAVIGFLRRLFPVLVGWALWPCRQVCRAAVELLKRTVGHRLENRRRKQTEERIRALIQRAGQGFPPEQVPHPKKKNTPHKKTRRREESTQ